MIAAAFENGAFEIVVEDHPWLAGPRFKRIHVAAKKVLRGLIEEELQLQGSRIRQGHHEAGQGALGTAHHHVTEVCPIDLSLLAR